MAKYSDIKGFTVQTLSSDTVANKYAGGAWTSGGNLPQVLYENAGAGATQTAALNFGGQGNPPGPAHPTSAETQTYNGSSWTEVNDLNTGRRLLGGAGTYTSAIAMGGYTQPPGTDGTQFKVELWDGTNWTETTDLNTKGRYFQGFGVVNTAAVVANRNNGSSVTNKTETWNGSAWTEVAESNTNRSRYGAAGTSTAGVIAGGSTPAPSDTSTAVEQWNGSAWTEIAEINTGRNTLGGSGAYTDALMSGGDPGSSGKTERYDGSSWTELSDLSTGRYLTGSAGHTAADTGIVFGGEGRTASTEEFTAPALFSKQVEGQLFFNSTTNTFKETLTDVAGATWAAGGNMVEGRYGNSGFGNHSNAITAGGQPPAFSGTSSKTEEYNGSAWSEVNDLNTDHFFAGALGSSYTAGIVMAGQTPPGTRIAITESWNGTNWTEVNDLNTARSSANLSATGTSTAGIYAGGRTAPGSPGSPQAVNESWDGTSWTEVNDLNTARYGMGAGGIQTSVLQFGGHSGTAVVNNVESWDGTSWTETTEMNTKRTSLGGTGSNANNILAFGGLDPPGRQNETEFWNGTSWTELNNLSTARQDFGSSSALSITNVIASGGETGPAVSAATEEWTVNLANKTITAS